MQKRAVGPLLRLAGKAVGFTGGKVVPKMLNAGYKGLIRPIARMAFKHPGMALTGAMMPSWIGGYMDTAGKKGLISLPRSLPKFASIQGEEMSDKKYPSIFYKIEGFEKMAAEAEAAHRLVKKASFLEKFVGGILGIGQKNQSFIPMVREKALGSLVEKVVADPANTTQAVKEFKNIIDAAGSARAAMGPKNLREIVGRLRGISPIAGLAAIGIPSYYFGYNAYKKHKENEAVEESYHTMLKIYPELQKENPQNTRQYFDYIKQYSPTVAKNPHAAGAIVRRFASTGGMAMDNSVIKNLLEVEKVKSDSKPKHTGILGTIGALI